MAPRAAPAAGSRRLAPSLLLRALVLARASAPSAAACAECAELDSFAEALHLQLVPFARSPRLFHARFEFSIEAPLAAAFRADQFDIFPKPVGKLLNAHPSIVAFEAALSRGRWQKEEWGPPPREFRPPGAVLIAANNSTDTGAIDDAWKFLISALSGSLCASFEGMDPDHDTAAWVKPLDVPWTSSGNALRFATLPYEPVCTENLTPWLKLLPCGRHRGLAALIAPIALAESPFVSLSLAVTADEPSSKTTLRASLDVVLPLRDSQPGFAAWFDKHSFKACPAAARSSVLLWSAGPLGRSAQHQAEWEAHDVAGRGTVLDVPTDVFVRLRDSARMPAESEALPKPWAAPQPAEGLSVMRDVLSQEGRSERTHGRYLLRFANDGTRRRVKFMDQLPFFIRPLWHTFRATFHRPGEVPEEVAGLDAMRRLELQFAPSEGQYFPTEVFLTVDLPPGGTVSIFLDVLKNFIKYREFSYACEKGFDVGSAAWMEIEYSEDDRLRTSRSTLDDFIASLAPTTPARIQAEASSRDAWRLRFTEGLIVLVPMPDFSMPFNVIALSSTAVTFFFGSIFRLTAAGRKPHWVLDKEGTPKRGFAFWVWRCVLAACVCGLYTLYVTEAAQLNELRGKLPPAMAPVVSMLESVKETLDHLS